MTKLTNPLVSYAGRRYGKLTVDSFDRWHETPKGARLSRWNCTCDCGGKISVIAGHLKSGACTDCGCSYDLLKGSRFGRLTLVGKGEPDQHGHRRYALQCDCGGTTYATKRHLTSGARNSCGCAKRSKGVTVGGIIYARAWRTILAGACVRDLPVTITPEYAADLFKAQAGKCAITGIPLTLGTGRGWGREGTASLDRIDSAQGYVPGNVQWVQKEVNYIKQDLTEQELFNMCKSIALRHAKPSGRELERVFNGRADRPRTILPVLPDVAPVRKQYV